MNEFVPPKRKTPSQEIGAEDTARLIEPVPDPSTGVKEGDTPVGPSAEGQEALNPSIGDQRANKSTPDRFFKIRKVLQQVWRRVTACSMNNHCM